MSAASQKGNLANFSFGFRRRGAHSRIQVYIYLIKYSKPTVSSVWLQQRNPNLAQEDKSSYPQQSYTVNAAAWEDEAGLLLQWNSDADGCLTGWGGVRGDAGFLSCGCRSEVV
ncbi:uncharacterized protein L3040_007990 [Drepanopeziza brunnea f. sp. 'multigermtubi']|uniref:uncharacterized protein n=1 Tax=Drepanopeziza brunnea f. sp. 'multigermtubi' TaxID=698441 RepID=UPI0023891ECE|nr:hypothetical protein L3040_007990 [Drepanopeziza brunnea f. sp. 'multigermtubi']